MSRWQEALEALRSISVPLRSSFNSCISQCSKARQWIQALELLEEMARRQALISPHFAPFLRRFEGFRSRFRHEKGLESRCGGISGASTRCSRLLAGSRWGVGGSQDGLKMAYMVVNHHK